MAIGAHSNFLCDFSIGSFCLCGANNCD